MSDYEESSSDEKPSKEFEERLSELKAGWKAALKRNKKLLLKCPNYDRCGFKCGSIGGMSYHFVRCAGQQPEFKCAQCSRSYESRTGLNYHMASTHHDAIPDELKNETTGRPQRSAALTTMSAIHIANNLPPLKQAFHKPPSHKTMPQSSTHNTTPPKKTTSPASARKNTPPVVAPAKTAHPQKTSPSISQKNLTSPVPKATTPTRATPPTKTTPPATKASPPMPATNKEPRNLPDKAMAKLPQPTIVIPKAVAPPLPPLLLPPQLITERQPEIAAPKLSPLLSPSLHKQPVVKMEESEKSKRAGRYITIPSIEYPDEYKSFLPLWRQEMKDNTIIKCPNYTECEFKCTTVNGMKYHYVRCMKSNPPEFNCELCEKRFQCRTGLVWHLKKTHKMIDIHPTKSGGYKGSLPIELKFDSDLEDDSDEHMMEMFQLPPVVSPVRKKIKLNEPWKRQQRRAGGTMSDDSALESSTQSGSDGDDERELSCDDKPSSRKRFRKSFWPRRTADFILQNLIRARLLPKPRLGPETSKLYVPSMEFSVSDEVTTDVDPKPSTILSLGIEALEWRKMYSDSESESDYNPEYDDTGRAVSYQSNSSLSDSDEEFMCSLTTRKKTTGGGRGAKAKTGAASGHVGGEGRPRRGRGRGSRSHVSEATSRDVPMLVKPPEDMSYGSLLDAGVQPPPVLIRNQPRDTSSGALGAAAMAGEEGRSSEVRMAQLPSIPALVKTPNTKGRSESNDIEEFDRLTNIPTQPSIHPPHHIQPPPSLVMPLSSPSPSALSSSGSVRRREPPPLVKNTDTKKTTIAAVPIQDSTHSTRPQLIRLSPSEAQGQLQKRSAGGSVGTSASSLSYTVVTQTQQPSYSIVTQQIASSPASARATSADAPPPKPRRPGRPRKDQSVTLSAGLRTSSKTVHLSGGRSRGGRGRGSGRGGRGGHTASPVTKKSMKMTQYEFENVSFPPSVNRPPTLQPSQQPQLFQVNSGGGAVAQNLQSIVTPLQIIPAGSIPAYHNVSGGGVLLMQGAPQGVTLAAAAPNSHNASTALLPQGGNAFQLVQAAPMLSADQMDNAQKVSVIMHPAAAGMGAQVQYITQLDGPPPKGTGRKRSSAKLRQEFEEERKKEQDKLQNSVESTSTANCSSKVAESAEVTTPTEAAAEKMMSSELEKYFKMEETRRRKTPAAVGSDSVSSPVTPRTSGSRKRPLPASESPSTANQSTEEEAAARGERKQESTRKTRGRKQYVPVKLSTAEAQVEEGEEADGDGENPLTSPPSKRKKTDVASSSGQAGLTGPTTEGEGVQEAMDGESSSTGAAAGRGRRGRGRGKRHTSKSKPEFTCDECGKEYDSRSGLTIHKTMKHAPLTADSTLQECAVHWRQALKLQKKVECPKCGKHKGTTVHGMKYHWERCGKSKSELPVHRCPQCEKTFTTEPGLIYHLKVHQRTLKPAVDENSTHIEPAASPDLGDALKPVPGRKAAKAAAERLSELCRESSVDIGVQAVREEAHDKMFGKYGFTSEQMTSFRLTLERDHSIGCPVENCTRKKQFISFAGLCYHLKRHLASNTMKCPKCRKVVSGLKRFENHIRSKHPEIEFDSMNMDDYEYEPDEEGNYSDDDEMFDEGETEKPKRTHSHRRIMLLIADAPVTLNQYQDTLKEKIKQLHSHQLLEQEGAEPGEELAKSHPLREDWVKVQDSELESYLPAATQSMTYVGRDSAADFTLPLFGSAEYNGGTAMLFAGGPIWAMDWLMGQEDGLGEQYVALTAYREYDETFPIEAQLSHKGLIQLWSAGDLTNKQQSPDVRSLPRMCLGIAHTFGCIRAIKACPHAKELVGVAKENAPVHLGVVALACSDGCVRIINIPNPAHLLSALPPPKKPTRGRSRHPTFDSSITFVKPRQVAAMLVPCGLGMEDWTSFGQCLCVDWFPGNQHTRIAAGYCNGYVCIWDIHSPLLKSNSPPPFARQQLHPLVQIVSQDSPCRSLAWCPHDSNYIATGGHSRCLTLWDIRQPFSPIDKQEKGVISFEIVWPLLWCHTLLQYDSSLNLGHLHGTHHYSYITKQPYPSTKVVTSNLGPLCSMSYSDWTDRVAASSFAGEVNVTSFDPQQHITVTHKTFLNQHPKCHKTVCHCYTKPLEDSTAVESEQSAMDAAAAASKTLKEQTKTHRLVFSTEPPSEHGACAYQAADPASLAVFTKISWNPNPQTSDWILLATNSGLVQLLHLPRD